MEPNVSRELPKRNLMRGTSAAQALAWGGHAFAEDFREETAGSWEVDHADIFISHSWSAGRWAKTLALCYDLNFSLAIQVSILSFLANSCLLLLYAGGFSIASIDALAGNPWLLPLTVDVPMAAFFFVFAYGHYCKCWARQILWLDKICISQTDVQCKAEAVAALPDFVKRSSRMLILWDETYFERLWCNVEIAVFLKSHPDPNTIRMIPLWLSPWLLCSLLLEWVCARYTVPLMFMLLAEWSFVAAAPPQSRLDWVLRNVIFCLTSTVAHLPSALLATLSFTLKLRQHGRLLDQLRDFDVRASKCTVESDRPMLEAEIASLHKEQKMSVEDVPLLFRSSGVDVHQEECLDLFSSYVRGQLHDQIVEELGNRTELPFGLCILVYMPMHFFNFAESFLACEGYGCEGALQYFGYQSVQQLFIFDAVIYFIMMVTTLPMTFPCLLKMLDFSHLVPGGAVVQAFLALASCLFSYAYAFCMGGLVGGCLIGFMVKGLSACWLSFFVGILGFLLVQCLTVFCAKSAWSSCNVGKLAVRCLGRTS